MSSGSKPKKIKASELDKKFDDGEDITPYLDIKNGKMNAPLRRVNIDIPQAILEKVDQEATRVGVPRTALIKIWIAERIDQLAS